MSATYEKRLWAEYQADIEPHRARIRELNRLIRIEENHIAQRAELFIRCCDGYLWPIPSDAGGQP